MCNDAQNNKLHYKKTGYNKKDDYTEESLFLLFTLHNIGLD